ncbi:autotransporter-associated beta strand repeat-containing protein [Luteolibacter sp. LG18]|uniref:beta strand repeat-containing protein n=1 Tax=Luteolibacter sp. LG18 TaxID=2819286 RepID=UPI0030C6F51B
MKSKLLPLFVVVCLSPTTFADTISWVGTTTGDWTTSSNWSNNAAPAAGNAYVVSGTGKAILSPSGGGALTFAGDSLTVSNGAILRLYSTSSGTTTSTDTIPNLTVNGATISPASNNGSVTGVLANQAALANAVTVEMNDTGSFTNTLTFNNGFTGTGSLTIQRSGGNGTSRNVNISGTNSTSAYNGAVTTSGNSSSKTTAVTIGTGSGWGGGSLTVGQWSSVTLTADTTGTGGATVNANGSLAIGNGSTAGSLPVDIVNNGTVSFNRTNALIRNNAISGTGSVTQNGTGTLTLAGNSSYTGGTTVAAGTLSLAHANAVGTTGTITMNGGGLQFTPANKSDLSARLTLADGKTATFDTNGRSVSFATPLTTGAAATAALTKTGSGTLTLSGANTYTGATTVSTGTLNLSGSLTSPVTVASGAVLAGSGTTTGAITLATGSTVIAGAAYVSGNGVTATGVSVLPDSASVVIGTNFLNVIGYGSSAPAAGEFSTAGYRNGLASDDTANARIILQFDAAARTWAGTTGNWDLGTSTAWTEGDQKFYTGDTATFGDIAADNVVTLTGTLAPSGLSVTNNTTFSYTFSGTGSITGTTSLFKSGTGNLVIGTTNSYTGGTILNGGTITATAAGALGTGAVSIATGTIALNGGTLTNTITGTGDILATGTTQGTLSGNLGGLIGTATVSTTAGGKLAVTNAAVLPATLPISVASGATLYGANATTIDSTVTLNGAGNTENLGALRLDSGATVSGGVVLAANSFIGSNSGTGIISGVISETGGVRTLTKQGGGTVMLSGANTYTGSTILAGGTLLVGSANSLSTTSGISFGATASTFDVGAFSATVNALTFNTAVTTSLTHNVRGSGTLTLNGAADLLLQNSGSSTLGVTPTVDMSSLSYLVYNRSSNNVSIGGTGNQRAITVHLANTSTFTAANFNIQDSTFSAGNTTKTTTVSLGTATTINANTVNTQTNTCDSAILRFRSVSQPRLTVRATNGTDRAAWNVGNRTATTNSANTATVDLTSNASGGTTLDALVSTLTLGSQSVSGTLGSTFQMGGGTLDATTILVGSITGSGTLTSTFSVTGGIAKVGTLTLGNRTSGTLNSTVNLNGGGTIAAQTIQNGSGTTTSTRTFNWNSGTITTLDASTDLTVSSALKLAATGTHGFDIGTSRTGTVSGVISEAAAGASLTKTGAGTLVLSGANTYTGDTLVNGGKLSIGSAVLADTADVKLANSAVLDLTHAATDTIDELYIDGVQQAPGTWGSLTSSATHKTARITGTGLLQVTTGAAGGYTTWATANAGGQAADGDYDNDGVKNGVEYFYGPYGSGPTVSGNTITWPKDTTATATPVVETSTDLITWTPVTFVDNTPTTPSIQYTLSTGSAKLFVRLRVTVP